MKTILLFICITIPATLLSETWHRHEAHADHYWVIYSDNGRWITDYFIQPETKLQTHVWKKALPVFPAEA